MNGELWALLAERGTFVFLHPSGVPDPKRVGDWYMPQLVGYPAETAIAIARMVFSGTLERHPIQLCLAHGGGCLPALRGRMDMGWDRKEVARTTPLPPSAYADRLYYDTAVFNTTLLRRLVEDVGAEHVMMGTDHPFELADFTPVETVQALGLDEPPPGRSSGTTRPGCSGSGRGPLTRPDRASSQRLPQGLPTGPSSLGRCRHRPRHDPHDQRADRPAESGRQPSPPTRSTSARRSLIVRTLCTGSGA